MTTDTIDEMTNTQKKDGQPSMPLALRERAISVSADGTKNLDIKKVLRSAEGRLKLTKMITENSHLNKK